MSPNDMHMQAQRGGGATARIHSRAGIRWRWGISITSQPLCPRKRHDVQLTRGLFASGLLVVQYSFKSKKYTPPKCSYL